MAKTQRLTGSVQGHAGQALTWTIYSDHGAGIPALEEAVANLANGLEFEWDSGDRSEGWNPFVSSTCSMTFLVDHDDEIDGLVEMAKGTESETYIEVEDLSGWRWIGSILPEELEVEVVDGLTAISLTFTDGLSLLKGYDFKVDTSIDIYTQTDEVDGEEYLPGRTGLGLVWTILNKIPWMQEVTFTGSSAAIIEIPGIGTDTTGTYAPNLPHMGFHPAAFAKETRKPRRGRKMPKAKRFVNCYDVLGDILETLGCRIAWDGEAWVIASPLIVDDFPTGGLGTTFTHTEFGTSPGGRINGTLGLYTWAYDLDVPYVMSSGSRAFGQKFSAARAVHVEAGSSTLWTKRDNAVMGAAQNFQDLIPGVMTQSDPYTEFEAESDITLRYQGYFDLKGGLSAKNAAGHKPCAVIKLTLDPDGADPYRLNSDMLHQGYSTTINGAATASSMRAWANATLPDANWIQESAIQTKALDGLADPYDNPGLLYIPLTWGGDSFNPSAPSIDQGADGTFYGGLHTKQESGETNVLTYDKWGQLHWDVTLPTITTPNTSLTGYTMEVGLAFFNPEVSLSGSFTGECAENLNTITGRDGTASPTADSGIEKMYDDYIEKFTLHRVRFYKGDGTSTADKIYYEATDNGAPDSFEFAEVRVATGETADAVGPRFINHHDAAWPTESWTYSGVDLIAYSDNPTTNPTYTANLELLADEWLKLNASGVETLSANFVPNFTNSASMPTGANLFTTTCAQAGTASAVYLPTRITWSSQSGLDFEGQLVTRDAGLIPFRDEQEETEEPSAVKPFIKGISDGLGGKNKSTADTEILAGLNKTAQDDSIAEVAGAVTLADTMTQSTAWEVHGPSGTRGIGSPYLYKINGALTPPGAGEVTSNLHFVGVDNNGKINSPLKIGLSDFDLSRAAGGTDWTTVDGGLTVNTWLDTTGATNGQALAYNSSSGDVEWTSVSGGGSSTLAGLTDTDITSADPYDILMVSPGGDWVDASPATVAGQVVPEADLEDLGNVAAGVANNEVLQYNSSTLQWEPETVNTILASGTLGGLSNVAPVAASIGEVLTYNGSSWEPDAIPTPADNTLQEVTTAGATTTDIITTGGVVTAGKVDAADVDVQDFRIGDPINGYMTYPNLDGTAGQFLQTDGAGAITFATISDPTLDDVTTAGATTTNDITVGELTTTGGAFIEGDGSNPYLTALVAKAGASSVFSQHWEDSSGTLNAYMFPSGNFVTGGSTTAASLIVSGKYILPTTTGTAGQVLTWPSSGTTGVWSTPAGGNPKWSFEQHRYNSVTTTTDLYYWLPGSTTYGFQFYDGTELTALSTANTWNRYKKMSHRIPETGTYDLDFHLDLSMSGSSGGTSNDTDYNSGTVDIFVYKVAATTGGDCTLTQIGTTQTNTQHATDTAEATTNTWTVSGESLTADDRLMVVLQGNVAIANNTYAHWTYGIEAEKTA